MDPGWERDVKFHEGWDLCSFGGEDGVNGSGGVVKLMVAVRVVVLVVMLCIGVMVLD